MIFYFCGSLIVASGEVGLGGEPQLACEAVDKRRSSLSRLQRELCAAFSPIYKTVSNRQGKPIEVKLEFS